MRKPIRLQKIANKETFATLMGIYKNIKKSSDIKALLSFKAFITRIIEAQEETAFYDGGWHRRWTDLDDYTENVISKCGAGFDDCKTPQEWIVKATHSSEMSPFGYNYKRDYGRTF